MNKKLPIVLLPVFLLACNLLFPAQETPSDQQVVPTTIPEERQEPEQMESLKLDDFTIVRLHPGDGDLQTLLEDEAQKAASHGLMPVVEFDATWCPPCQAIDAAIKEKNELMMDAYRGTYIIKLDVDEWGWGVGEFEVEAIPIYFKVDSQGKPTGKVIDGGAWGEDIPENIAPVMDRFFHGD